MCYHAKFDHCALNAVGINIGEPPKLGALELHSLVMRGVADPKIHGPPLHVKIGSSATKGVGKNITEPQKFGSAGTLPLWLECG